MAMADCVSSLADARPDRAATFDDAAPEWQGRDRSDSDVHFRDVARAAATDMTTGDDGGWDDFCSELFTQEMMGKEETPPGAVVAAPSEKAATPETAAPPAPLQFSHPRNGGLTTTAVTAPAGGGTSPSPSGIVTAPPSPQKASAAAVAPRAPLAFPPLPRTGTPASLQFSHPRNDVCLRAPGLDGAGRPAKLRRADDGGAVPANVSRTDLVDVCPPQAQAKTAGDGLVCVHCRFPHPDVRVRCPAGCAFHARCLDLAPLGGDGTRRCPHCALPARGCEILPLDSSALDGAIREARTAPLAAETSSGEKRVRPDLGALPTVSPACSGGAPPRRTSQCYDPSRRRVGRWTDEEISFRDALIGHFLAGSLPLGQGLKLSDFLPAMLQSKQSRLAKKMKKAKLSTKYFHPQAGRVAAQAAQELSRLEQDFVASVLDPVERAEVHFHMGREWREYFARRCTTLSVPFDGAAWLGSVEEVERRLLLDKERHRARRRALMMGKAMEQDCDPGGKALQEGVFVRSPRPAEEEVELVVARSVSNSTGNLGGRSGEDSSGVWSSDDPNFRQAEPFLSGIASYVERNGVPFEHVDVWVPNAARGATEGSGTTQCALRLCFGGSVTVGVQVDEQGSPAPGGGASHSRRPLPPDARSDLSLFGRYSEKFSFSTGCGLPGRVFQSGAAAWERFTSEAEASRFERRGGAAQFGIKTALGLPVDSPNAGRVVVVLYSKFDRPKDEALVGRMMVDLRLLCPCLRWKLVVEVDSKFGASGSGGLASSPVLSPPSPTLLLPSNVGGAASSNVNSSTASTSPKDELITSMLALLASNMPSDATSPLSQQINDMMTLRLLLLRDKTPTEEALVDSVLVLYESYLCAGRDDRDIVIMVTRDFKFHMSHLGGLAVQCRGHGGGSGLMTMLEKPAQVTPPSMYTVTQAGAAQTQGAELLKERRPHLARKATMHMSATPLTGPVGGYNNYEFQGPAPEPPLLAGCPYTDSLTNYTSLTAKQNSHLISPLMVGVDPAKMKSVNHHPNHQAKSFFTRQDSSMISEDGSLESAASR